MYMRKSEIIDCIQSFHKQLSEFYLRLYEKEENQEVKILLKKLSKLERFRKNYLEKYKEIARVENSMLCFSYTDLEKSTLKCFKEIESKTALSIDDIALMESHFDECLIQLYISLSVEDASNLPASNANMFTHMFRKTLEEEKEIKTILAH